MYQARPSTTRPTTAPASSTYRTDRVGINARTAGIPGILAPTRSGQAGSFTYGVEVAKATGLKRHALQTHSPYAVVTATGWEPVEASVCPTHAGAVGAGVVSAGSIDNTYMPAPLMNAWGKAREMCVREIKKPPRKQATDLLIVAKGGRMPAPAQTEKDMGSVRPAYSKTIPLFHGIDPMRVDSGFLRGPNTIPGSQPPPKSPYNPSASFQQVPPDHKLRKLYYDQTAAANLRIPVARVVRAQPVMPPAQQQRYLATPAGMPGGLALGAAKRPATAA